MKSFAGERFTNDRGFKMKFAYRAAALKAALCSGAAVAVLAASPALAASQILAGDYIEIGLNDQGTLGFGGSTSPGILYDGTGTGTFNPSYDYLTPGSPFEGFTIQGTKASTAFSYVNNNAGTTAITGGTLTNYNGVEYNGTTYDLRAVWTATVASLFTITNDYYFNLTDQQVHISTTISALSDLTGLTFSRALDPDAIAAAGDSSATNNYRGADGVAETDLVYAEALVSKYVIGLYTDTSYDHNSAVTSWTRDTASYLAGTNVGNGDNTIGLGFSLGDLASGTSLSFDYAYIFGTDINAAIGGSTNITGTNTTSDLLNGTVNPVLDGGTLLVDASDSFSGDLSVTGASGTIDTDGHDAALTGVISGSGSLTKTGEGTLVLTGANTYAGGTVIAQGTLVGNTTSIQGDITNNAALVIDQATDGTLAGDISGTGTFTKDGTGTVTLTGTNTYTGGTTVLSGTLVGDTNSLQGNVANSGTVVFDQAVDGTYAGTVSGSGALAKTGSGTLVLTGANTYTGGTTIADGALVGGTDSIQGAIVNNAALVINQTADGTLGSDISGTGSFTKDGTGTVTLTGANSYTGGTTVHGGTLVGDTNSLQGNVANSGTLVFAQTADGAYTGAASGSGALVKTGSGTLVLTGINSYSGGTTIADGTLVGNTNSVQGDIVNNAALIIDQNGSGTLAGDISGTGSFAKDGTGTVWLTGTNTYAGGTTVLGGNLVGDTNSLQGDIANSGNVVFNQTTDGTYTGAVSGSGVLAKTGSGTLTLTGANSYTGGTLITDGTLVGNSSSIQGPVVNASELVFDQADAGAYAGSVTGAGNMTKTGAGSLNLAGVSDYSGTTTVEQGRLAVNGSIANSDVTVLSGATIGGNGTVGGLIVRNGATAAPGNSIGNLHVATDLTFEKGSTYAVETNAAGNADRIPPPGTATIEGGTVQVLAEAGDYKPQTNYVILTATGGGNGTFDDVTSNFAFLTPTLSYAANGVTLTLTRNDVSFAQAGKTANQIAVGTGIDGTFAIGSAIYDALVGSSTSEIGSGLDALSGEIHGSALSVAADDATRLRRTLLERARSATASSATGGRIALWSDVGGNWSNKDGNGNAAKVDASGYHFTAGAEFNANDTLKLGVAGGTSHQDVTVSRRGSKADVDAVYGAVYAAAAFGPATLRAGASYSDLDVDTERTIDYRSLQDNLKASYGGSVTQTFAEAGVTLPLGAGSLEPFVGYNFMWLKNDAFTENGGTTALKGRERTRGYGWTALGARMTIGSATAPVAFRTKVAWEHATSGTDVASRVAFAAGGNSFVVDGAPLSRDSVNLDAGIEWRATSALSLGAGYTGSLGTRGEDHGVRASASFRF